MAINREEESLTNANRVVGLEKSTSLTGHRLSDNLIHELGTSRPSEVKGQIGDDGKSFYPLLDTYIDSL